MKYNIIKYLIFVFLLPYLAACESDDEKADIAFVKFFGDGTNDYGTDICEHNNTIYVLANGKDKTTDKESPYIYYLNSEGEFLGEPLVLNDIENDETGQKLLIDNESNLYLISNVIDTARNEKIHVRKIQNKSVVSLGFFGDNLSGIESVSSVDATISESEIAIIGNAKNSSNKFDAYYLIIGLDGNILIQNKNGDPNKDEIASKIIKVEDYYYFTGYTESQLSAGIIRGTWLVKIKSDSRNPLGAEDYGSLKMNEGLCLEKSGNTIILASYERSSEVEEKQLKVYGININDKLDIRWDTEFVESQNIEPSNVVLKNNGFLIVSNKYPNSKRYGNICIYQCDNEGNFISKEEFGSTGENATYLQARKAILVDGELFIVGYNEFNDNSDIALIKLKSGNDLFE